MSELGSRLNTSHHIAHPGPANIGLRDLVNELAICLTALSWQWSSTVCMFTCPVKWSYSLLQLYWPFPCIQEPEGNGFIDCSLCVSVLQAVICPLFGIDSVGFAWLSWHRLKQLTDRLAGSTFILYQVTSLTISQLCAFCMLLYALLVLQTKCTWLWLVIRTSRWCCVFRVFRPVCVWLKVCMQQ